MKYQKMKWRDKCDQLMADNRRMTNKLIDLNSKLLICEQKYLSIEAAFDLSQKLVQHLKTENQLLRSSTDLLSMSNPLDHSMTHSLAITESTPNCDNRDIVATDHIYAEVHKPNEDLCKSDLIAVQYEREIKELQESLSLLSCLPIDSVVVTIEDQLNANSHLCSASESEEECEEQMDVDINEMSTKISETSEAKTQHMEVKTEYMEDIKPKVKEIEDQTQEVEVKSKCKYCGKKFAEESTLDEHKLLHKSSDGLQIRCAEDYCGHQFDRKHELKEHLKQFHISKDKNNMKFSALKAKYEMNSNQSSTKRVFECKECNKQLSSMHSLRSHQKSIHNMVSTFKCKFSGCDQTFEKSSELRVHEEVHRKLKSTIEFKLTPANTPTVNGEDTTPAKPVVKRQYPCKVVGCNASYVNKTSLKKHEEKNHPNIPNILNSSLDTSSVVAIGETPEGIAVPIVKPANDIQTKLQLLSLFMSEQQKVQM